MGMVGELLASSCTNGNLNGTTDTTITEDGGAAWVYKYNSV